MKKHIRPDQVDGPVTRPNDVALLKTNKESLAETSKISETSEQETSWTGWAELENDPVIFNTLLQEWGVRGVRLHEIYSLEMVLEGALANVLGLIFLSRWKADEDEPTAESVQDNPRLWFANQISTFSCGTVALMNVIMNCQHLELGPFLEAFRDETWQLGAKKAGMALDRNVDLREVHNSFTTKLDRQIVDLHLRNQVTATRGAPHKRGRRRQQRKVLDEEDSEDSGFHFIAYISLEDQMWKLDGMKPKPHAMGMSGGAGTWLTRALEDLERQMNEAIGNGCECSLLSVVDERDQAVPDEEAGQAERLREDWAPFIETILRTRAEMGDLATFLT